MVRNFFVNRGGFAESMEVAVAVDFGGLDTEVLNIYAELQ